MTFSSYSRPFQQRRLSQFVNKGGMTMADNDTHGKNRSVEVGVKDALYHVIPLDGDWVIKKLGRDKPIFSTNIKEDAIREAKKLATEAHTIAYIHNDDSQIEDQIEEIK